VSKIAATEKTQRKRASKMMQRPDSNPIPATSCATQKEAQLCGLVLAGGEGQRLRSFVRRLRGDALSKQYVKFTGAHSMLEHTFRRAEILIPRERLFAVVNQNHMKHEVRSFIGPIVSIAARRNKKTSQREQGGVCHDGKDS
jgi:hypothetical protein